MSRVDYGDGRRAASFLAHVITQDAAGVYAVIDEAAAEGRLAELLRTVAAFLVEAAPEMRNTGVLEDMRSRIVKYTELEQQKENNDD